MSTDDHVPLSSSILDGALRHMFPSRDIAAVRHVSIAFLERERWQNSGPKYIKIGTRVLYRKAAVLDWIKQHEEAA